MATTPEDKSNEPGTGLVVKQSFKGGDVLAAALGRTLRSTDGPVPDVSGAPALPTEVRRVRRGKFFLTDREQSTFGSISKPIFQYYCHGVVVGETIPDEEKGGIWCFAAHNDFDLIPEFQPPSSWPEYTRTPTGWIRADGARRISEEGTFSNAKPEPLPSIDSFIQTVKSLKRLK